MTDDYLRLLSDYRFVESQLARMEQSVAEHFGFTSPAAPPYHVLMQWLTSEGGAVADNWKVRIDDEVYAP